MLRLITVSAFVLLSSLGLSATSFTSEARAQMINTAQGYGSGLPQKSHAISRQAGQLFVSLMRDPDLPEDYFILRVALNTALTGCPKTGNLESRIDYSGEHVNIDIGGYQIDLENLPLNPHECTRLQRTPAAEIVFDRNDFIDRGVKILRLRTGQVSDFYDVHIDERTVRLSPSALNMHMPQYYKPLSAGQIVDPLQRWFYPDGTLMLYAPDTHSRHDTADIERKIRNLAAAQGLKPLEEIYTSFVSPVIGINYLYYVDTNGTIAAQATPHQGHEIGHITIEERLFGLVEDEIETRKIKVYAKKPGMYE